MTHEILNTCIDFFHTRRRFLQTSSTAIIASALAPGIQAQKSNGGELLRVGLIGCGGRGTDAADHHSVIYEYASGVKLFAYCR